MTETTHRIEQALKAAFAPEALSVVDDSARHAGHAGNPHGRGGTHFVVEIVADAFAGKSRVERHRLVNAALADEFEAGLHALSVTAKAPGE
ncbi:BolA family protein [Marinicauda salina]|uniref:BolA family protein n=1 Tax=Marinicauda salina TaxID=2135793 RepID=UPI001E4CF44F|nr:BolA family protein [Marinicauda salina]